MLFGKKACFFGTTAMKCLSYEAVGLDPNNFPKTWNEYMEAAQKLTRKLKGDKSGNIF